ncbi:MAG: putative lipid II flippase FtsW [Oligoflexia bacterium]|nr:putative lipid II flippase FtsW [Oligoflexia bacterium]
MQTLLRKLKQGLAGVTGGDSSQGALHGVDYPLLFTVIGMVLFGLLMVYSSSFIYAQEKTGDGFSFIRKQIIYSVFGFIAMAATFRLDYRSWTRWSYYVLGAAILMLALVLVPGVGARVLGARRWIHLGPLNFQPGEFAKFAVIFFVASQLARKEDIVHRFAAGILAPILVPLPAMGLLLLQPDFGTTVMIMMVIFFLMFLGGVPKRFLASALILAGTAAAFLALGSSYRRSRILGYLDPWADPGGKGFQIIQSLVGLHNGHFWGVGLGNGKEKLFYLPEAHNDFIFAVIGEELGFLGIAAVIVAYLYFVHRGLRIAYNCQKNYQDTFGMLLAAGITLALGLQGFVNIAVVMGLLPTKGLTLPFISYGGSALMIDLFAVGVLLSVARGPRGEKPRGA